jgi:hypothetical protein
VRRLSRGESRASGSSAHEDRPNEARRGNGTRPRGPRETHRVPVASTESFHWLDGGYFLVSSYETVFGDEPSSPQPPSGTWAWKASRGTAPIPAGRPACCPATRICPNPPSTTASTASPRRLPPSSTIAVATGAAQPIRVCASHPSGCQPLAFRNRCGAPKPSGSYLGHFGGHLT